MGAGPVFFLTINDATEQTELQKDHVPLFGMVLSMTSMMTHGGTLCPIPYFYPKYSLACITSERITCFNGVLTMFIAMFNHEDFAKTDFSHVRTGIMADANCPADLMRRAAREMNMTEIISVYGQTEASPGCTIGEVNEDEDHRVETVGSAFPGVECKIIDPETGLELPDGENGEFVARGFNIMQGYEPSKQSQRRVGLDRRMRSTVVCCFCLDWALAKSSVSRCIMHSIPICELPFLE